MPGGRRPLGGGWQHEQHQHRVGLDFSKFGVAAELGHQPVQPLGAVVVLQEGADQDIVLDPDAVAVGADELAPFGRAAPLGPSTWPSRSTCSPCSSSTRRQRLGEQDLVSAVADLVDVRWTMDADAAGRALRDHALRTAGRPGGAGSAAVVLAALLVVGDGDVAQLGVPVEADAHDRQPIALPLMRRAERVADGVQDRKDLAPAG